MLQVLIASLIILAVLLGWLAVQRSARKFALRHPEYGPPPGVEAGCAANDSGCDACGLVKNDCPNPTSAAK